MIKTTVDGVFYSEEMRDGLEGNLCRCTGYHNIVKAVRAAAAELCAGVAVPVQAAAGGHLEGART